MALAKKDKPFIHYMHPGAWPVHIGFTTSVSAFNQEMKRLGVEDPSALLPQGVSNATTNVLTKDDQITIVVFISKAKKVTKSQMLGLICHESVHVWNEVCDAMKGDCPKGEHQAYGVQWIAQCMAEVVWGEV